MLVDYKIVSATEKNGQVTAKIRFYAGDITTEEVSDGIGRTRMVTCYRRTSLLKEATITVIGDITDLRKKCNELLTTDIAVKSVGMSIKEQMMVAADIV